MQALFTIGYEKADPADFIATLRAAGIDILIDVRERAMSRRKGFAKTALRNMLAEASIDYRHEPSLGSPSEIRNRLKRDRDYDRFFREYEQHLDQQGDVLDALAQVDGRAVLLCYERNPNECHRLSVARRLTERTGLEVQHLGVSADLGITEDSGMGTRQSVPPA